MRDYLESQIAKRRERLQSIDRERSTLLAELNAYQDALLKLNGDAVQTSEIGNGQIREQLKISRAWNAILTGLVEHKHFNASEVMLVSRELFKTKMIPKEQTKDGIRAQLSLYAKKGFIRRRGGGNYRLSEQTRVALTGGVGPAHATKIAAQSNLSGPSSDLELALLRRNTAGDAR